MLIPLILTNITQKSYVLFLTVSLLLAEVNFKDTEVLDVNSVVLVQVSGDT